MRAWLACAVLAACSGTTPARDASPPTPADARIGSDGGPGVACVDAECQPGQACCREILVPGQVTLYCLDDAMQCEGATYTCDGPEDCDAGPCCADLDGQVACAPSCAGLTVCHTDADCPGGACCDTPNGVVATCCAAGPIVRP